MSALDPTLIPTPIQLMKVPPTTPFTTTPAGGTLYLRTDEAEGQIIFRPTTTDRPLRSLPRHATVYVLPGREKSDDICGTCGGVGSLINGYGDEISNCPDCT